MQNQLVDFFYQAPYTISFDTTIDKFIKNMEIQLENSLSKWYYLINSYKQFCAILEIDGKSWIMEEEKYKYWDINGKLPINKDFILFDIFSYFKNKLFISKHKLEYSLNDLRNAIDWNFINRQPTTKDGTGMVIHINQKVNQYLYSVEYCAWPTRLKQC